MNWAKAVQECQKMRCGRNLRDNKEQQSTQSDEVEPREPLFGVL